MGTPFIDPHNIRKHAHSGLIFTKEGSVADFLLCKMFGLWIWYKTYTTHSDFQFYGFLCWMEPAQMTGQPQSEYALSTSPFPESELMMHNCFSRQHVPHFRAKWLWVISELYSGLELMFLFHQKAACNSIPALNQDWGITLHVYSVVP